MTKVKTRRHRGNLADSLATVVEVTTMEELLALIRNDFYLAGGPVSPRIGADTVTVKFYHAGSPGWENMHIVAIRDYGVWGYTDGPIEENMPLPNSPFPAPPPAQPLTIEQIEVNLSNDVYKAALWFERAENAGLIYGNGHHMAQELAQVAVSLLQERIRKPKDEPDAAS